MNFSLLLIKCWTILWCYISDKFNKVVFWYFESPDKTIYCSNSQNRRTIGLGRDLWRSSIQTSWQSTFPTEDCISVQVSFEYLERRRLHSLPGQPVAMLCHTHKKFSSHVQIELSALEFVPYALYPVSGHHQKQSGSTHLTLEGPRCPGGQ